MFIKNLKKSSLVRNFAVFLWKHFFVSTAAFAWQIQFNSSPKSVIKELEINSFKSLFLVATEVWWITLPPSQKKSQTILDVTQFNKGQIIQWCAFNLEKLDIYYIKLYNFVDITFTTKEYPRVLNFKTWSLDEIALEMLILHKLLRNSKEIAWRRCRRLSSCLRRKV